MDYKIDDLIDLCRKRPDYLGFRFSDTQKNGTAIEVFFKDATFAFCGKNSVTQAAETLLNMPQPKLQNKIVQFLTKHSGGHND